MRPSDSRRQTDDQKTLDPEAAAGLDAVDAALTDEPVPEGGEEMARLAHDLRAERPEPDPAFAAELDRWAAGGFGRARPGAPAPGRLARVRERLGRLTAVPPRRLIAPAGAAATLLVVVGVAVSQNGGLDQPAGGPTALQAPAPEQAGGGGLDRATPGTQDSGQGAGENAGATQALEAPGGGADDVAPDKRRIAQAADLVLAAEPAEVSEVADGVNRVVNRHNGFVSSSAVRTGEGSGAALGAEFELRIPAARAQAALAELSELAHVRSRTDSTEDITARFVDARERIAEAEASRESLLERLADAQTDQETEAIRAQLRDVNARLSGARAELADARQRVRLVPVSVAILAEEGAGDDGSWGLDEALDDAGQVLSAVAGVALVSAAVLLPVALLAGLLALALRARTRRGRERALDE